jgi:predicted enzyme related to lactoylglutathione lyase
VNPAFHFEIPVADLQRAMKFHGAVFGHAFERASVDDNEMAFLPYALDQAVQAGGAVPYSQTAVAGFGWVAAMLDSKGACVDLHTRLASAAAAG